MGCCLLRWWTWSRYWSARPHAALTYRLTGSDLVEVKYGVFNPAGRDDLVERIGVLTAYPQITMSGFHPEFELLNHAEAAYIHHFNKSSSLQVAAYRDSFHNIAVWGFGSPREMGWLAANALPNPAADGWTLNAGNYTSSGLRVVTCERFVATDDLLKEGSFHTLRINRSMVDAVVETQGGAHPTSCEPDYDAAGGELKRYVGSAASDEEWNEYRSSRVDVGEDEYQKAVR